MLQHFLNVCAIQWEFYHLSKVLKNTINCTINEQKYIENKLSKRSTSNPSVKFQKSKDVIVRRNIYSKKIFKRIVNEKNDFPHNSNIIKNYRYIDFFQETSKNDSYDVYGGLSGNAINWDCIIQFIIQDKFDLLFVMFHLYFSTSSHFNQVQLLT